MLGQQESRRPRLWISYPWTSKVERDFTYLVSELKHSDIEATYDTLQLQPDARLQERIMQRLRSIGFDGWVYILTQQILAQTGYTAELIAAIELTHRQMGSDFPILGLLHGISTHNVPPAFRSRPCLSLRDPDWAFQVSNVLRQRAASKKDGVRIETRFVWRIHPCWDGDSSKTAFEVGTYSETIPYWRFAIPRSAQAIQWGVGPAGGNEISTLKLGVANGSGKCGNSAIIWFGAANKVTNRESAFIVFSGPPPEFICFGPAESYLGPPGKVEVFPTNSAALRAQSPAITGSDCLSAAL